MWRRVIRIFRQLIRLFRRGGSTAKLHFLPQTDREWVLQYIDTDGPEPVIKDENVPVWAVLLEYFRKGCNWDFVRESTSLHRVQIRAVEAYLRLYPAEFRPYFQRSLKRDVDQSSSSSVFPLAPKSS